MLHIGASYSKFMDFIHFLVIILCFDDTHDKQAQILKSYPSKLMFTSLQSLSSAIQSFGVAIAFERDIQQWKLGWNMRLFAVVYSVSI